MKFKFSVKVSKIAALAIGVCLTSSVFSQKSQTPLMGWASWNHFSVDISESIIKGQADAMVSSGLSAAGYKYLNIDDGFFNGRNADGSLKIDEKKFPKGMKYLADYIHSKGLKAGYYSEAGANTCGAQWNNQTGGINGGLYGHDQQDINTIFKEWKYDFIKVDYCGGLVQRLDEKTRYTAIKNAIDNTGRKDINYNVCRWQFPGTWVTTVADSWRMSQDINASWGSVLDIINKNTFLAAFASKGHYNDMDMLEVGRGLTAEEDKTHFSMWCIFSSPLLLGNDMSNMTPATKEILTNTEVIAVNQDTTGLQAHLVADNGAGLQVFAKNLNGRQSKERAVVLFNRNKEAATMSINWETLNLVGAAKVRDLWLHKDLGTMEKGYSVSVPAHGVVMLKVVGTQTKLQETFEAEYAWVNNYNLTQYSSVVAGQGNMVFDGACSGRGKAIWLGKNPDNYIEFQYVYAEKAGNYTMTISYICPENRTAVTSVNGKEIPVINFKSAGWNTIGTMTVPITLQKGYNKIRFSNATDWLPDLDKIHINLNSTK